MLHRAAGAPAPLVITFLVAGGHSSPKSQRGAINGHIGPEPRVSWVACLRALSALSVRPATRMFL